MHYKPSNIVSPVLCACLLGYALNVGAAMHPSAQQQVIATERAFAKSMARRDQASFSRFISSEAVFYSGDKPLRGKSAVIGAWAKYFMSARAPFSWEPSQVEVLESGTLALSSGPVRDPSGKLIGTFTSIWRRGPHDTWRIVFDKGNDVCNVGSEVAAP